MFRIKLLIHLILNFLTEMAIGCWLLATGHLQLDDGIKLSSFSISCQKPKAKGQKLPSSQVMVP